MMKKSLIGLMILSVSMLAIISNQAHAKEKLAIAAEKAVILFMEGDVKVKSFNTDKWIDAAVDMVLSKGDSLKTGIDSWAEIGFGEEFANVVKVKENTLVELIDLGPVKIGLLKGEIRSLVESLTKETTFEVKTPTAVCGARGTGWDTNTDGTKVIVDAYEDEVYFYPLSKEGETVVDPIIKAGKRGILTDPTKRITIRNIPMRKMRDWNRWKRDFTERRAVEKRAGKPSAKPTAKGTIQQKIGKIQKTQKSVESVVKGKASMVEKKQQDKIDKRIDDTQKDGDSTQY